MSNDKDLHVIHNPESGMYIHFNPRTQEYFSNKNLRGSAIFYKKQGYEYIRVNLDKSWKQVLVKPDEIINDDRENEVQHFDITHSEKNYGFSNS